MSYGSEATLFTHLFVVSFSTNLHLLILYAEPVLTLESV